MTTIKEKSKSLEKNLVQLHFDYEESRMELPGNVGGPLR